MFVGEEAVVEADFGAQAVCNRNPGDDAFDFDAGGAGGAAFGVGDDGGVDFGDSTDTIFQFLSNIAGAFNDVAVFQADFVASHKRAVCPSFRWEEAEEAFGRGFFKVGALNPHLFAQLEAAVAQLGVVRVEGGGAGVHDAAIVDHAVLRSRLVACGVGEKLVPVGKHQLHGVEHGHSAGRGFVQALAQAAFQRAVVYPAVGFGDANALGKELYRLRGVATAAQADDGWHARVVPAADFVVIHQLREFALAGDDVGEVQPGKLILARVRRGEQAAFA